MMYNRIKRTRANSRCQLKPFRYEWMIKMSKNEVMMCQALRGGALNCSGAAD